MDNYRPWRDGCVSGGTALSRVRPPTKRLSLSLSFGFIPLLSIGVITSGTENMYSRAPHQTRRLCGNRVIRAYHGLLEIEEEINGAYNDNKLQSACIGLNL